jgi:hypothetical protein
MGCGVGSYRSGSGGEVALTVVVAVLVEDITEVVAVLVEDISEVVVEVV